MKSLILFFSLFCSTVVYAENFGATDNIKLLQALNDRINTLVTVTLKTESGDQIYSGYLLSAIAGKMIEKIELLNVDGDGDVQVIQTQDIYSGSIHLTHQPPIRSALPLGTVAETAKVDGIRFLSHQTTGTYFGEIFKSGELRVRSGGGIATSYPIQPGIYLELMSARDIKRLNSLQAAGVHLIFDLSLLDRNDYHLSRGWPAGYYSEENSAYANNSQGLHEIFWDVGRGLQQMNELVFKDSISVSDSALVAIVVPDASIDAAVNILLNVGVLESEARRLVIGRSMFAK